MPFSRGAKGTNKILSITIKYWFIRMTLEGGQWTLDSHTYQAMIKTFSSILIEE